VRLDVRVRAISGCLRFDVGIADAERSRQRQLEQGKAKKRKSGALDDQVIYSDCLQRQHSGRNVHSTSNDLNN
jgi:hypothetical protein